MSKKLLFLIIFVLLIDMASAATIHGTIYSFDLEPRNNTIVTIDSVPPQTIVSKDSDYSFELSPGEYTITASYNDGQESVIEPIKIAKEGSFVFDLILFPSFAEEDELLDITEEEVVDERIFSQGITILEILMFAIAIAGLGFVVYLVFKYRKVLTEVSQEVEKGKLSDDLEKEVVAFIKEKGGRSTQKDIRKHFPSSEAKISLIISELQHKEILEKIKKGRGNVIILKK